MIKANEYPCFSLADMVTIPEEALPRFLAELPMIIQTYRDIHAAADAIESASNWPFLARLLPRSYRVDVIRRSMLKPQKCIWVDDDKQTATVNFRLHEHGPKIFEQTHKFGSEVKQ